MPARYKNMGMAFLPDGRLAMGVIEVVGNGEAPPPDSGDQVVVVDGAGKAADDSIHVKVVAHTWRQISGLTVAEGKLYVSDRDGFYRIDDLSGNADPARNRTLMVKWPDENTWPNGVYWHQWVFTPLYWRGRFYAPYSGAIGPGGWSYANPTTKLSGAFLTWDSGGKLAAVAGGLRSPNGAAVDPATGEIFVTDNQGSWLPSSTLMRIRPGRFYGHRQIPALTDDSGKVMASFRPNFAEGLPYEPPVAWLPHRVVRNSPSQPAVIPAGRYQGDWLIGDVNFPGLVRVSLDRVDSAVNGAVFWFSQGMQNAAINRLVFGPDGALYIGTIMRVAGNWPASDKMPMFRMVPKPRPAAFDMRAVRSLKDGLEVVFTEPVAPASLKPDSVALRQWQYVRRPEYGLGKQADEFPVLKSAALSRDGLRLHLVVGGLKTDRVVYVRFAGVVSAQGKPLFNNEGWFTLNAVSSRAWTADALALPEPPRPPAGFSIAALARPGSLQVTVTGKGPFRLSLRALDGALIESRDGTAPARVELPAGRRGMLLLQAELGGERLCRKVIL